MNISKTSNGAFNIECNLEELIVLCNALNNIPQAVSESEYSSLIGRSQTDTRKIIDTILEAVRDPSSGYQS
jgi:hypothetical protein